MLTLEVGSLFLPVWIEALMVSQGLSLCLCGSLRARDCQDGLVSVRHGGGKTGVPGEKPPPWLWAAARTETALPLQRAEGPTWSSSCWYGFLHQLRAPRGPLVVYGAGTGRLENPVIASARLYEGEPLAVCPHVVILPRRS